MKGELVEKKKELEDKPQETVPIAKRLEGLKETSQETETKLENKSQETVPSARAVRRYAKNRKLFEET